MFSCPCPPSTAASRPRAPISPPLSLRGKIEAARFVEGRERRIVAASAPLRRAPDAEAPLETEALHGETVVVYEESGDWAWAQLARDLYVGYLPTAALAAPVEPTHRVAALRTHAYPGANVRLPPRFALSLGALLRVERFDGDFAVTRDGLHVYARHLAPIDVSSPTSSRSPSASSRRPISGAGAPRRESTVPASSRARSAPPGSRRRATAT